MKNMQKMQRIF